MTEPTRDALHAETLAMLEWERERAIHPDRQPWTKQLKYLIPLYAYAAECVRVGAELEAELDKWREREASVCPEDFGFEEVIKTLRAEVERLREALRGIAGGPAQEGLCGSPTRRMEHIMGNCLHCKARTALAAATREGADA